MQPSEPNSSGLWSSVQLSHVLRRRHGPSRSLFCSRLCASLLFCVWSGLAPYAAATLAPIQADSSVRYMPGPGNTHVNDNYGTLDHLVVASGGTGRAFVRFDLSTMPAGTTGADVEKATL